MHSQLASFVGANPTAQRSLSTTPMDAPEQTLEVIVTARASQSEDTISLDFCRPDQQPFPPFTAGAHIDLRLTPNLVRQYSLCNDPAERHRYRLGVQLAAQSRGGSIAAYALNVGDRVQISSPRNHFPLIDRAPRSILVGGGIGITPLISMAHRLSALHSNFELHYCVRNVERAGFLKELESSSFADRLTMHYSAGPEEQRFSVAKTLSEPEAETHIYVCGSTRFIGWVIGDATGRGWKNLHKEYFNAEVDTSGDVFVVKTARTGLTVEIPTDKTISQVLQEHGIKLPLSCEQGVCGACLTPVLEGVPDHRDVYQTPEEHANEGQIAVCCSRSKSPVLKLDI